MEEAKNAEVDLNFFISCHHAIIKESGGRFLLITVIDQLKDQSYFLPKTAILDPFTTRQSYQTLG
jgi:hypothetical protein